ncbi:hypothetical protein [Streptomyces sp. 3214.6]|uniref:hypothetical protein n=1 Tax=Streptomyces sp. 3214.6 TaxID=1882757 RepID=UPI001E2BE854|nr:hypothetical protein [Streptomyces sp. 3214.6]
MDTNHFVKRSPWRKYPDAAIAEAAASSASLREVALKLGAAPATGTLSHIRRRIDVAGIDISHFPGIDRPDLDLPFTPEELCADHVNGDWRDNREENLRYLCPNCHALTETWCRRKRRVPLAG